MKDKTSKLRRIIKRICLVDKCLIIIMIILFIHVAFNLFTSSSASDTNDVINSIDIIVRTTIASIFGYFISSNFIKNAGECSDEDDISLNNNNTENNQFCLDVEESIDKSIEYGNLNKNASSSSIVFNNNKVENDKRGNSNNYSNKLQVVIVTIIGIISLILLLWVRDSGIIQQSTIPTISQLRDVVCGCIGFLLGSPSNVK